jgi:hypothetical protein
VGSIHFLLAFQSVVSKCCICVTHTHTRHTRIIYCVGLCTHSTKKRLATRTRVSQQNTRHGSATAGSGQKKQRSLRSVLFIPWYQKFRHHHQHIVLFLCVRVRMCVCVCVVVGNDFFGQPHIILHWGFVVVLDRSGFGCVCHKQVPCSTTKKALCYLRTKMMVLT